MPAPALSPTAERRIGYLLIVNAFVGLALGLLGLVGLWWAEPRLRAGGLAFAALAGRTVDTTSGVLVQVDAAVATAQASLDTLESTLAEVADTLESTASLTRSASRIAGQDVQGVLAETQSALGAVQKSAGLVDDTLGLVSRLPLLGQRYQPEVPLAASVARVGRSLERLPASLSQVEADLADTATSLAAIRQDVRTLAATLGELGGSLAALKAASAEYQDIAASLQADLDRFQAAFPTALRFGTLFGSAVMLWLIVAQLGLLTQGLERLHPRG